MKTTIWAALGALLLLIVLGGCGASQSTGPAAEPLVIVSQDIAAGLDPVYELTSAYLRSVGVGEGLMRIAADGSLVPELAEAIVQRDATTWDVTLRAGVTFWSGAPVDAAAVVASLERSRALDAQAAPYLEGLTFAAADARTVRITTAAPNPLVPFNLAAYQLLIHNAERYGPEARPFELEAMDMTGMYRVTAFEPKQRLELEASATYWGTKPQIERVRHDEVKDAQARVLAIQSGQAQIATGIAPESAVALASDARVRLVPMPAANTTTVYLNLAAGPLSDERVRQALNWGVDRAALVELAREGFSVPVGSWLASNPAYSAAAQAHGYTRFDPEQAAALLDEAGWKLDPATGLRSKGGAALELSLLSFGGEKAVAEVLEQQWRALGIVVKVEHVDDYGLIQARRDAGDWDALIEAWGTFGDPQALLSAQFKPGGAANYGGFDDPAVNALFAELAQAEDAAARSELALAIDAAVAERAPVVALHPRPQITAVAPGLAGFEPHFRQFERLVTASMTLEPTE